MGRLGVGTAAAEAAMSTRHPGSTAAADAELQRARARRQALAGSIRQAQLELERITTPAARREQLAHEQQALADALAALLRRAPEPTPTGRAERELAYVMRELDSPQARRADREPAAVIEP